MKAILISIQPKYISMILNKTKTIEVRKRFPLNYRGWVYIYCTKKTSKILKINKGEVIERDIVANEDMIIKYPSYFEFNNCGKVVARFYCDNVEEISYNYRSDFTSVYTDTLDTEDLEKLACLTKYEFAKYLQGNYGYAIHISQLEIFDEQKELSEFYPAFYYKGDKPYKDKQTYSLVHKVVINGKFEYERVHCLTKAPQNFCYVEIEE